MTASDLLAENERLLAVCAERDHWVASNARQRDEAEAESERLRAENERLHVDLDRVAGCECHKGPWGGPDRKGGYDDGWRAAMRFAHHAHAAPNGHHPSANGVLGAGPDAVIVDEDWLHDLTAECDRLTAILDAVRKYADEREANGRRGRSVHSIRIASDLRRILDGANTERPEPTGLEGE